VGTEKLNIQAILKKKSKEGFDERKLKKVKNVDLMKTMGPQG